MTLKPLHNWQLKLLSLLSAVVLWFFVIGIENTVYLFPENFQVKAHNLGKSVSLATALPEVKIYVNTNGKDIKTTNKNDFEAFVDLSGLGEGSYELPVMASSQNAQVSVLKTDPDKVNVLLSPVVEKQVKIIMSATGSPASGYTVKEFTADTDTVKITAARNILDKINELNLEVPLAGSETADVTRDVIVPLPAGLNLSPENVRLEPPQVTVTAVIVPAMAEKSLKINPVLTGGGDLEAIRKQLIISPASVTVSGEENFLKTQTQIDTEAINADSLLNRTVPFPVELDLPAGLEPTVSVRITVKLASDKF
jgi:YbbR domain-containing protein